MCGHSAFAAPLFFRRVFAAFALDSALTGVTANPFTTRAAPPRAPVHAGQVNGFPHFGHIVFVFMF